jgi:hypothetical protein
MATLKFRCKGNGLEQRSIKEIVRKYEGEYSIVEIKPSKMSDQDVVVSLSFPGEQLPGIVYRNAQGMAQNRAIHLVR